MVKGREPWKKIDKSQKKCLKPHTFLNLFRKKPFLLFLSFFNEGGIRQTSNAEGKVWNLLLNIPSVRIYKITGIKTLPWYFLKKIIIIKGKIKYTLPHQGDAKCHIIHQILYRKQNTISGYP